MNLKNQPRIAIKYSEATQKSLFVELQHCSWIFSIGLSSCMIYIQQIANLPTTLLPLRFLALTIEHLLIIISSCIRLTELPLRNDCCAKIMKVCRVLCHVYIILCFHFYYINYQKMFLGVYDEHLSSVVRYPVTDSLLLPFHSLFVLYVFWGQLQSSWNTSTIFF